MAMKEKGKMRRYEEKDSIRDDTFPGNLEPDVETGSAPFTWRGLVIAVIAAIVLSLTATLLLGGSFGVYNRGSASACGPGSACCPPAAGS
jgi:hypothetical protein